MANIINQEALALTLSSLLEPYKQKGKKSAQLDPDLSQLLPSLENVIVESVLVHTRGNLQQAGRVLGMDRGTVRKYWKRSRPQFQPFE